jgi:U3 small nucleolar ribonucleoprotein component
MLVVSQSGGLVHHVIACLEYAPEHVVVASARKSPTTVESRVEPPELESDATAQSEAATAPNAHGPSDQRCSTTVEEAVHVGRQAKALPAARVTAVRLEQMLRRRVQRQSLHARRARADVTTSREGPRKSVSPTSSGDGIVVEKCDDFARCFRESSVTGEIEALERLDDVAGVRRSISDPLP